MRGVAKTKLTPDMLTLAGVTLCLAGAVLVGFEERNPKLFFWLGGFLFVVGSVADILDGALARAASKGTVFGAFLDSTFDRLGEAAMLAAIGLVFMRDGNEVALVATFAAVIGSFLVSYTRAKAEALGLRGDVGFGSRVERVVLISSASASPRGAGCSGRSTCSPRWPGSPSSSGCSSSAAAARARRAAGRLSVRWIAATARRAVEVACYTASSLTASTSQKRAGILVRMPAPLKGALVRETARRASNVNDVAVGILADAFGVPHSPTGRRRKVLAGSSPVVLLRVPQELKDEIQAEASRHDSNANDVILAALADGLGVPSMSNRKGKGTPMAATNGSKNGARAKDKVRVAIIGVGNCANSLLQGVEYYKDATPTEVRPRASCTSISADTTSRTSSSWRRSTSSRARSASTSRTRSGRIRTTRSSSRTSRRPASRCRAE